MDVELVHAALVVLDYEEVYFHKDNNKNISYAFFYLEKDRLDMKA